MNVRDFTAPLEDANAIAEISRKANVPLAKVREVAALLGDLPATQLVRIYAIVHADRQRQTERMRRKR